MKVLWVCNIMLPVAAGKLGILCSNREGWLSGIFEQLTGKDKDKKIELGICFPAESREIYEAVNKPGDFSVKGVPCYAFLENLSCPERYDSGLEVRFQEILSDFKPDILHIFGTEFPHALAAAKVFHRPEKTLIGIQGLCYKIAEVYMAGLPKKVCGSVTLRDFIRKDSLKQQQEKFRLRGENEKEALKLAAHITGRTRFDREGTAQINKQAVYHSMNETMRPCFYEGEWKKERCEKHSIFFGQGDYPLKGFHFMLEAMPLVLKKYPDAVLYVSGNSIISDKTLKERLKLSAYGKYLLKLIERYQLKDRVVMLGKLTAEEMKQRFLNSNVFVCASVLENSPNTVGEAMLLGVPVVASAAGGIPDMLIDGKEGLLFAPGNVSALAQQIEKVFEDEKDGEGVSLTQRISGRGRRRAGMAHDGETNYRRLMEIYGDIAGAKL